jgi:hypothetical protein
LLDAGPAGLFCQDVDEGLVPISAVSSTASVAPGNAGVRVVVTGVGLSNPTGFSFGGLAVTGGAPLPGASDTTFTLDVSVPSGFPVGRKSLTFKAGGTRFIARNVVTLTAITVSPTGDDANQGTPDSPFRTFKHATQVAGAGDTIQLKTGTYDASHGEDWSVSTKLPDAITVLGEGTKTILQGPAPIGGDAAVNGLTLQGSAILSMLSIRSFHHAVVIEHAAEIPEPSVVSLSGLALVLNGGSGLFVDDDHTQVSVADTYIEQNGAGITLNQRGGNLTLTSGDINKNAADGISHVRAPAPDGADAGRNPALTLVIKGTQIADNGNYALELVDDYAVVTITGDDLRGPILFQSMGPSSLTMHTCTIAPSAAPSAPAQDGITFSGGLLLFDGQLPLSPGGVTDFTHSGIWQQAGAASVSGTTLTLPDGSAAAVGYLLSGGSVSFESDTFVGPADSTHFGFSDQRSPGGDGTKISTSSFNGMSGTGTIQGPTTLNGAYVIANSNQIVFR